jgi:hypothetical protein
MKRRRKAKAPAKHSGQRRSKVSDVRAYRDNFDHFFGPIVSDPFGAVDRDALVHVGTRVYRPSDPPGVYRVRAQ